MVAQVRPGVRAVDVRHPGAVIEITNTFNVLEGELKGGDRWVWDGTNWNSFGTNKLFSTPHEVYCITKFNNQIIVGGRFDSIGNVLVNNIVSIFFEMNPATALATLL